MKNINGVIAFLIKRLWLDISVCRWYNIITVKR